MDSSHLTRRSFISASVGGAVAAFGLGSSNTAAKENSESQSLRFPDKIVIAGKPYDRGRQYGKIFREPIRSFLNREIFEAFIGKPALKDDLLRYAKACSKSVQQHCPVIFEELEGMSNGSGLDLEEHVLLTLHEELYHRGVLPMIEHCTAVAVGPPATPDGTTLVGQTWDWMQSVFGLSSIIEWRRDEGPSLLAYGFPGLWIGAGLNSSGLALTWTSADLGVHKLGVRVGVPSYIFLAHLLYQNDLDAVIRETEKDMHAGWFTFVMADGNGELLNVEGSPGGFAFERTRGKLVRVGFGTPKMTSTPEGRLVKWHPRCDKMLGLLKADESRVDLPRLQHFFQSPDCGISVGKSTIDMMIFDTTSRKAWLSRGPNYLVEWRAFAFDA